MVAVALAVTGCASMVPTAKKTWAWLQSGDPEDDNTQDYKDPWAGVGKEARNGRLDDERDPWNAILRSPKAAAIENNLGVK